MTDVSDCESIYLYEVEVTSKILEIISNPTLMSKNTSLPTIRRRKIPFKPYASFQTRIIELLSEKFETARPVTEDSRKLVDAPVPTDPATESSGGPTPLS